jgi:site-specific recombinase XerD
MKTVDAVKTETEIKLIAHLLSKHKGEIYSDIWVIGINVALRISDLLAISMQEALKGSFTIIEAKTNKERKITLNATAKSVVERRQQTYPSDKYLFQVHSNRSKNRPIGRNAVSKAFKEVGEMSSVEIALGTHSMRKTLGWMMHSKGASIERICRVLNHSHPAVTMRYIGLTDADTQAAYSEFEISI